VATPYIHAKAIVVDGGRVYVGSANFTANSFDHNRECGLLTSDPDAVTPVATTVSSDFSGGAAL
jgi:phosphatidylserine/phosphatidylglycerophosphate/cardiolipin synthase-like enzyme